MAALTISLLDQLGFQTNAPSETTAEEIWANKVEAMQLAIDVMLRDAPSTGTAQYHVASVGYGIMMNLQFIRWQQSPSIDNLLALLSCIDTFVDAFASCASAGIILYWPYTSCVVLSQPAAMLFKVKPLIACFADVR